MLEASIFFATCQLLFFSLIKPIFKYIYIYISENPHCFSKSAKKRFCQWATNGDGANQATDWIIVAAAGSGGPGGLLWVFIWWVVVVVVFFKFCKPSG